MNINGTVKVGKKDYFLNYDINTLCIMKAQGFNVMKLEEMETDFEVIRDLLYFGLFRFQKDISKEEAGDIMSDFIQEGNSIDTVADIIMDALGKALGMKFNGEEDEEEGKQ